MATNLVVDPSFEARSLLWQLAEGAAITDAHGAHAGSLAAYLPAEPGSLNPPVPEVTPHVGQVLAVTAGRTYSASAWVRKLSGSGAAQLEVEDPAGGGLLNSIAVVLNGSGWQSLSGTFIPGSSSVAIRVRAFALAVASKWQAEDLDVHLVTPNADHHEQLLANVQAVITAADPNIGAVLSAQPRWASLREVATGAGLTIVAAGSALDATERNGRPAVRFWTLSVSSAVQPATNRSREIHHTVKIRGYYQLEADSAQDATLQLAAALITAALAAEEFGDLSTDMGDGYMGFLDMPPTQDDEVKPAKIGDENAVHGFSIEVVLHAYEEIAN